MRQPTFSWFAIVLYPAEDAFHKHILEYVHTNVNLYPISLSVNHDRDFDDDDDDTIGFLDSLGKACTAVGRFKKAHTHLLVKCVRQMTVSAFLKRFDLTNELGHGVRLGYAEPVNDPIAYTQYMAHMDFRSLHNRCKSQYRIDEFRGNPEFIQSALVIEQNINNWQMLLESYQSVQRIGFAEFARSIVDEGNEVRARQLWTVFSKSQGLFLSAENQHKYQEMRAQV